MKRKFTGWQFIYQLLVKCIISIITLLLLTPCMNLVVEIITNSEHKEAFYLAHYRDEPEIFFNSILGIEDETEVN